MSRPGGQRPEADFYQIANACPTKFRGDQEFDTFVAHTLRSEGADASEDGTGRGTPLVVAFGWNKSESQTMRVGDVPDALQASPTSNPAVLAFDTTQITSKANRSHPQPGHPSHPLAAGAHPPAIVGVAIPRRLTPRECERLQGWADDWTRWGRKEDGTVVELSDSARYRMAGNGVSGPVAEWIGRRIVSQPEHTEGPE